MNWLNLRTETLRSPEFSGASPAQIGVWLRVLAYCCEQENGGRIAGAASWNDRQWMMTCGITLAEMDDCPLLFPEYNDLVVASYPIDKQEEVRAKREAGARGGKKSGEARREAQLEGELEAEPKHSLKQNGEVLERNGKENGKGMEVEKEAAASPPPKKREWLPSKLETPDFRAKWEEFLAHVRENDKVVSGATKRSWINECEIAGAGRSITVLSVAIRNGWKKPVWDFETGLTLKPMNGHRSPPPRITETDEDRLIREAKERGDI